LPWFDSFNGTLVSGRAKFAPAREHPARDLKVGAKRNTKGFEDPGAAAFEMACAPIEKGSGR
jgi:hypothetical protein